MRAGIATATALAVLLLAAACGDGRSVEPGGQVENLVRTGPRVAPSRGDAAPPRLEPMGSDDIEAAGIGGAGCDFSVGEQVLLVAAAGGDAAARIDGEIVRLFHQGEIGATGGFFASRDVRISVGRIDGAGQPPEEGASWPARIAVTTPAAGRPSRIEGRWSCGS